MFKTMKRQASRQAIAKFIIDLWIESAYVMIMISSSDNVYIADTVFQSFNEYMPGRLDRGNRLNSMSPKMVLV
jgi:hypothetical protein